MGTRILKIDEEMPEINECKVGNPQISISRNWANLSQPWILTFFEDEIFKSPKHWEKSKKWLCYKPEKFTRRFGTPGSAFTFMTLWRHYAKLTDFDPTISRRKNWVRDATIRISNKTLWLPARPLWLLFCCPNSMPTYRGVNAHLASLWLYNFTDGSFTALH